MVRIRRRAFGYGPMDTRSWPSWLGGLRQVRAETILLLCTLLSVIIGTIVGLFLNPLISGADYLTARQLTYLKFPGEIFMRSLQAMIVPMIVSSNVSAICSLNPKAAKILAVMTMAYYVGTTMIAVIIGIVLVQTIKPGTYRERIAHDNYSQKNVLDVIDSILDVTRNLIPDNWVEATFKKTATKFQVDAQKQSRYLMKQLQLAQERNVTNTSAILGARHDAAIFESRANDIAHGTNILGLIMISVMFGVAVRSLDRDAAVLAELFRAIRRAMVYLVSIVIWFSPIGIMSLIAAEIANTEEVLESVGSLYMYVSVMLLGLFIHVVIVLPLLLYVFTKRNPLQFARNMLQALVCAIGTASSTATLPCTLKCLESGNNIDPRVTRFMLPLGTTINMDGTAMYEAIAVIYISQRMAIPLDGADLLLLALTSMLASMAAASMPSAGLLTMAMVLKVIGLPSDKFALILPVDWFLDRFRTTTNVFSDAVGAAIVSKLCERHIQEPVQTVVNGNAFPLNLHHTTSLSINDNNNLSNYNICGGGAGGEQDRKHNNNRLDTNPTTQSTTMNDGFLLQMTPSPLPFQSHNKVTTALNLESGVQDTEDVSQLEEDTSLAECPWLPQDASTLLLQTERSKQQLNNNGSAPCGRYYMDDETIIFKF